MALKIAVGTLLGLLTGLGVGGGSLLMLWLTIVESVPQETARGINLLFFLPSALAACLFHRKQGTLPLKKVLPGILSGTVSAGIFSFAGLSADTDVLKKGFGLLLIATGLREIFYNTKKTAPD